jgi:two-component system, cell cycle response regulator
MKILVAEDETVSRRLIERTLQRANYEVIAVENGQLAVEQLCQPQGPRLALLDWVMPELDGPGVCSAVRRQREQPYVYMILLSSKESKQDIVTGLESGADDYLVKPFDPEELRARLRTGLRILELEDKLVAAREDMRFKATHDPLTSLFNRGVILDLLNRELARTRREDGCTAVLLGDLDHFKEINDTYGHVVGDEVLREVASRLLGAVRSYDFVGRYGGEEFLVVLNNCGASAARVRAEEIRESISGRPVKTKRGPLPVTMSLGALPSRLAADKTVEEILLLADVALYEAKAAGRNCVRIANPNASSVVPDCAVR